MQSVTKRTQRRSEKALRHLLAAVFAAAHAEQRVVMSHEEFLFAASLLGLTDAELNRALLLDMLRKGVTGYWLRETPDPGALLVMTRALRAAS